MKTIVPPRLSLAVPLVLILAACAATPPEAPVKIALPASYAQAQSGWEPAQAMAAAPRGAWWSVFDDPVLAGLETQVAQHNQSLAAQLAAYEQAQAAVAQAQAAYYPAVTAGASANRARTAGNGAVGNSLSASLGASWEPDLWGKVRLQVQAGQATAAASAATLANTQLSLQSTLATSYLQLRTVDAQIVLAQNTVAAYQRALQITDNRYKAGVGTAADVASARTQLLQAQTSLTDLGVTRVQLQNAIAVLVGKPPAEFSLSASDTLPEVPAIPAGIPAQLLQRRPDLAAAQAQVQAANAQIGVAQTAWFPNLTLSAQGGSQAARIAELFSAPSLFWSIGPQLAATLFDGGLRRAQVQSSQAAYRQTVANYRQSVLTALQQVEDNLAAQRILAQEAQQQAEVVQAAEVSLRLAENQYKAGTAPYLNVITAQTTATGARNAQLTLLNRRYAASVALIQALGGGWGVGDTPAIGPLPAATAGAR
ncbi:MAG: efflux transporter outer membrane subunit [Betaproteobacteria bacterium]|jgi:NodT family efflux transporter outer membrane factor (OMF) lipoprotein|uniref:efflux transporter outer membrane subunit n=1 Tax=unclassified Thiomonas TaxID=2625466 RepID=UPI000BD05624|nr:MULTISPECIES: efflux transporter outer membrane subunit [unclassified Thiomonas]MDE2176338.1 efflux transporter outer membrane subunit [Betaproteobacteria bacterium]OYV31739.1 MAG: RND transporter [Thiomonas sp. 20-64-9]OZB71455.1 MAG: RND transporter [Thiomonas sp. 13-64-67]